MKQKQTRKQEKISRGTNNKNNNILKRNRNKNYENTSSQKVTLIVNEQVKLIKKFNVILIFFFIR